MDAFSDSSDLGIDFRSVLVDFVGDFLFERSLHLHGPLLGHDLEVGPLHLDALAQLVTLLVHIDDDALEDGLLLGELGVDGFVQGQDSILCFGDQLVHLFIFLGQ